MMVRGKTKTKTNSTKAKTKTKTKNTRSVQEYFPLNNPFSDEKNPAASNPRIGDNAAPNQIMKLLLDLSRLKDPVINRKNEQNHLKKFEELSKLIEKESLEVLNTKSNSLHTPIYKACYLCAKHGGPEMFKIVIQLIKRGVDLNPRIKGGETPLAHCIWLSGGPTSTQEERDKNVKWQVFRALVEAGASLEIGKIKVNKEETPSGPFNAITLLKNNNDKRVDALMDLINYTDSNPSKRKPDDGRARVSKRIKIEGRGIVKEEVKVEKVEVKEEASAPRSLNG